MFMAMGLGAGRRLVVLAPAVLMGFFMVFSFVLGVIKNPAVCRAVAGYKKAPTDRVPGPVLIVSGGGDYAIILLYQYMTDF